MNKNDLGKSPAFPRNPFRDDRGSWSESSTHEGSQGMDLRTYIATKCLAGMLSDNKNVVSAEIHKKDNIIVQDYFSKVAVEYADALITELSKNT